MRTLTAVIVLVFSCALNVYAEGAADAGKSPGQSTAGESVQPAADTQGYTIGVDDVVEVNILQPEKLSITSSVAPDGSITVPYIGSVYVKGQTLSQSQEQIQGRLADGYMKYPVVAVNLQESRSRKFFVYGEVAKPGTYTLEENTTVLRAISLAGGFSKFGSASRVKVLRPLKGKPGYETLKVNIKAVMDGSSGDDLSLQSEDIVVVSEGVF